MTKKLFIVTSAAYFAIFSFPVLVGAQDIEDGIQIEETVQNSEEGSVSQRNETLEERVKTIKEKTAEKITESQQRRIEARCSAAQEKINSLRNGLSESIENRRDVYDNVAIKLDELSQKLVAADVDVSSLNLAIDEMENILTTSRVIVDSYMQNLADLTEMDCTSDAEGFKVLLDDSRKKRVEILSNKSEINRVKNEILKPELQSIRELLNSSTNNQESGE